MSHEGFLLRGAGDEQYEALLRQTRVARNLLNRVILALLGYDGPVFVYTSGKTERRSLVRNSDKALVVNLP